MVKGVKTPTVLTATAAAAASAAPQTLTASEAVLQPRRVSPRQAAATRKSPPSRTTPSQSSPVARRRIPFRRTSALPTSFGPSVLRSVPVRSQAVVRGFLFFIFVSNHPPASSGLPESHLGSPSREPAKWNGSRVHPVSLEHRRERRTGTHRCRYTLRATYGRNGRLNVRRTPGSHSLLI